MADSSRELVAPDITAAVGLESYPRFVKRGFQDYEGLGIKRSTADSKHVPSPRSRLLGNNVFEPPPESSRIFGITWPVKTRSRRRTSGTSCLAFRSGARVLASPVLCQARRQMRNSRFPVIHWNSKDTTHARPVMTLRAKAPTAQDVLHHQMISVAAAITIPVTNAVKQENNRRSFKTTLMAASPCGPWSNPRAQGTLLPWRKSDLVEPWSS